MKGRSLKAQALQLLAQREHSRSELRRKLLPQAIEACAATEGAAEGADKPGPCLDKLLDWLEAHRYLSEERFAESRINARSAKFGTRRITQELAQHGVTAAPEALQELEATEFERASLVWARKFAAPAATVAEQARQMRFLAGRGFAPEVIRRVVPRPKN